MHYFCTINSNIYERESNCKDPEFKQWLTELKSRIRQSQIKAMIKVNDEMLRLYWDLGHDIVVRQMDAVWGGAVLAPLLVQKVMKLACVFE